MYQNRLIDIQDTHNIDPEIELEDPPQRIFAWRTMESGHVSVVKTGVKQGDASGIWLSSGKRSHGQVIP
jgi:hypothetical protein